MSSFSWVCHLWMRQVPTYVYHCYKSAGYAWAIRSFRKPFLYFYLYVKLVMKACVPVTWHVYLIYRLGARLHRFIGKPNNAGHDKAICRIRVAWQTEGLGRCAIGFTCLSRLLPFGTASLNNSRRCMWNADISTLATHCIFIWKLQLRPVVPHQGTDGE